MRGLLRNTPDGVGSDFRKRRGCWAYLIRLRWPEWFSLSALSRQSVVACSSGAAGVRGLWMPNFPYGGNDLPRTPGLRCPVWIRAMWWITMQKNGSSAWGLQRVLGLKKYETPWTMLYNLRRAMVRCCGLRRRSSVGIPDQHSSFEAESSATRIRRRYQPPTTGRGTLKREARL